MAKLSGIILHRLKYSDTSLIVKILTREQGVISSIARGVRKSKKGGFLFQVGNIIDAEYTKKATSNLYSIKECTIKIPYLSAAEDISKNMLIVFLSEILLKSVEEGHQDKALFDFVLQQFLLLDALNSQEEKKEFHLHFLTKLTRHLGFYPNNNYQKGMSFNLFTARFSNELINFNVDTSVWFAKLLSANQNSIVLETKSQRRAVLLLMLKFYKAHINGFGEVKSLNVLEALND